MGMPMRQRVRQVRPSSRRSSGVMWRMGKRLTIKARQARPDTPWEMTVARAAPATPVWQYRIRSRSRAIFSTEEMARKYTGVLLSPRARITAANRL